MLTGSHDGVRVGACTDCRRYWGRFRAQEIDADEVARVNNQLVASVGTCSVMGTASTMACVVEGLGMMLPGGATPPAVTADRIRIAERTGATAVAMANSQLTACAHHERRGVRECAARAARHRRLHQRHHPSHRHRRPPRHQARPGPPRRPRARHAGAGRPQALGLVLHGGFPQGGRHAGAAARTAAAAAPGRDDRHRAHPGRRTGWRRSRISAGRDPTARQPDLSAGRHRRAARQSRAERGADQAVGCRPEIVRARRPGGGVRVAGRSGRAHRCAATWT